MTLYSTGVWDKKETKQKWGALRHYLSASFKLLDLLYLCFLAVLFLATTVDMYFTSSLTVVAFKFSKSISKLLWFVPSNKGS